MSSGEAAAETRDEAPVGPKAVGALIARRDFGPYFVGNALSASGTWFQNLAASLLVYRLTHSALLLGVLNFAQFIPILVLAPWAAARPTASTGVGCCWSPRASPSSSAVVSRCWPGRTSWTSGW